MDETEMMEKTAPSPATAMIVEKMVMPEQMMQESTVCASAVAEVGD